MSSNSNHFFAVSWILHDDPTETVHVGPPLFLRKNKVETGDLVLSPRSRAFVERHVEKWNHFAKRGTHSVCEVKLTKEVLDQVRLTYGKFKRIEGMENG